MIRFEYVRTRLPDAYTVCAYRFQRNVYMYEFAYAQTREREEPRGESVRGTHFRSTYRQHARYGPVVFSEFTRSIEFHALVPYTIGHCARLSPCDLNYSFPPLEIRVARIVSNAREPGD